MNVKEWISINERISPVFRELTDEFVDLCQREPNNIMMRLARTSGLPEGVNPLDRRILDLFKIAPICLDCEEPNVVSHGDRCHCCQLGRIS